MGLKADSLYYWRVRWHDGIEWSEYTHPLVLRTGACCIGIRSDLNNDTTNANILDLTFAVDRIFRGGPCPVCPEEGDVNSGGDVCNILDLTFLVDRIFRGGPLPGPCE